MKRLKKIKNPIRRTYLQELLYLNFSALKMIIAVFSVLFIVVTLGAFLGIVGGLVAFKLFGGAV